MLNENYNEEIILDAFTGKKKKGFFKVETWVFVFTNYRLIIAIITSEMQKKAIKEAKGYFNKIGTIQELQSRDRFMQMSPKDILTENPNNFKIEYNKISKVTYKRSSIIRSSDPEKSDYITSPVFYMEYESEKLKTPVGGIKDMHEFDDNFIDLLYDLFGNKFKCKK